MRQVPGPLSHLENRGQDKARVTTLTDIKLPFVLQSFLYLLEKSKQYNSWMSLLGDPYYS